MNEKHSHFVAILFSIFRVDLVWNSFINLNLILLKGKSQEVTGDF